ncbi:hypothetical protein JCGZ_25783 [Jatropha curcas]|uniref:Uncharacterized protein n=1 Tax=Jatropha curcas TaxID=180498 RepID=A0A067JJI0_JATCU|nr:hypothetical protein JCGZ_25783 [Jatropha curcas]
MVVSLGPGKFYGSSLPRPRIYTDVKFNSDRVDPPVPVMEPFLSWAQEAHWSMGGLNFKRLRLQGRIEGNVDKLRKHREKQAKLPASNCPKDLNRSIASGVDGEIENNRKRAGSDSPPPAPKVNKRRKFMDLFDEDSEEEVEEQQETAEKMGKKKPARKLVGDFEMVADSSDAGMKTRRRRLEEGGSGNVGVGDVVMKVVEELNRENSAGEKLKGEKKVRSNGKSGSSPLNGVRNSPRRRGLDEGGNGNSSVGAGDVVMEVVEELNRENSTGKKLRGEKKGKSEGKDASPLNGVRISPRLAKQRSS